MTHALNRLRARLTYANVTATLALFIALGGTSYAAASLARNSVGSAQIRTNAVGSSEIRSRAVGSSEIRDRTIALRDIAPNTRSSLRGASGPAGPAGPTGPPARRARRSAPPSTPAAVAVAGTARGVSHAGRLERVHRRVHARRQRLHVLGDARCRAERRDRRAAARRADHRRLRRRRQRAGEDLRRRRRTRCRAVPPARLLLIWRVVCQPWQPGLARWRAVGWVWSAGWVAVRLLCATRVRLICADPGGRRTMVRRGEPLSKIGRGRPRVGAGCS